MEDLHSDNNGARLLKMLMREKKITFLNGNMNCLQCRGEEKRRGLLGPSKCVNCLSVWGNPS